MRTIAHTKKAWAVAAAAGLVALAGCGSASDDASDSPDTAKPTSASSGSQSPSPTDGEQSSSGQKSEKPAEDAVIMIEDYEFEGPDSVSPGAEITVKNEDDVAHTVTADDEGDFDVNIPGGETATFTAPDSAGDYPYHCTYHSNMTATLTVR